MDSRDLLTAAAGHAADFLDGLPDGRVAPVSRPRGAARRARRPAARRGPTTPRAVIDELVAAADPGLVAIAGAALLRLRHRRRAARPPWPPTGWPRPGTRTRASTSPRRPPRWSRRSPAAGWPSCSACRQTRRRLRDRRQMANVTGLAAARHARARRAGWDVEARRACTARRAVRVVAGEQTPRHDRPGAAAARPRHRGDRAASRPTTQGRDATPTRCARRSPRCDGPTIVCAQAGNVNTGAFDPFDADRATPPTSTARGSHVDGAFGLWAGGAPAHRAPGAPASSSPTRGHRRAQVAQRARTTAGIAFVRASRGAPRRDGVAARPTSARRRTRRDALDLTPESSRRARGVRRSGRRCARSAATASPSWSSAAARCARRFAEALGAAPASRSLNDVVLNQVLVRFGDDDAATDAVIAAVQARRHVLAGGDDVARAARDAHLGVELGDDDRGCRPLVAAILAVARARLGRPRSR